MIRGGPEETGSPCGGVNSVWLDVPLRKASEPRLRSPRRVASSTSVASALPYSVTLLLLFLTYLCVDIVSPALPAIQDDLAMTATGAGLVFAAFFAGRLVSNLPAAWVVERSGPRITAAIGAALLLLGSLISALAPSEGLLLPARGIQGIGVAFLATAGLLSVLRARPGAGSAMTAFNVCAGVGGSVGIFAGGFLTTNLGWRYVFWLSAAAAFVLLGSLVAARSIGVAPRKTATSPIGDNDSKKPRFSTRVYAAILANFMVYVSYAIWVVSLALLAAEKFRFDAEQIGFLLLFVNTVHLLAAIPIGGVIRKIGAPLTLGLGFSISGIGLVLAPFAPSPLLIAIPLMMYSIGQVAGNSAAGDLILRTGGEGGKAVGAVRLSSDLGMVVGPAFAGLLTDFAGVEAPFRLLGVFGIGLGCLVIVSRPIINRRGLVNS